MKKRIILLSIFIIYISSVVISPIIPAAVTSQIDLETKAVIEKPLKIGEKKEIELQVSYKLNVGNVIKIPILNRFIRLYLYGFQYFFIIFGGNPTITLNLSIESPDWCTANLEPSEFQFTMDNNIINGKSQTTKLTYILKDSAPALINESININANFNGFKRVPATSNTFSVPIVPVYISDIVAEADNNFTIPPLKNYSFPINITNNGNGETSVSFEINKPDNWNVSYSSEEIIIPTNETKQMTLTVINPPKDFDNETLLLTIKPKSTIEGYEGDVSDLEGTSIILDFTFNNDGSLKDNDNDIVIDITLLIVILLIVVVLIVFFFFFIYSKKQ